MTPDIMGRHPLVPRRHIPDIQAGPCCSHANTLTISMIIVPSITSSRYYTKHAIQETGGAIAPLGHLKVIWGRPRSGRVGLENYIGASAHCF